MSNAIDNMGDPRLNEQMALVRDCLERRMIEAPLGPEKDHAKEVYIAMASINITARAGANFDAEVARSLAETETRLDFLDTAVLEACRLFRESHGAEANTVEVPAGADLIHWLMGHCAKLSAELDAALKVRPTVVRMSERFPGNGAFPGKPPAAKTYMLPDTGGLDEAAAARRTRVRPAPASQPAPKAQPTPAATPAPAKGKKTPPPARKRGK